MSFSDYPYEERVYSYQEAHYPSQPAAAGTAIFLAGLLLGFNLSASAETPSLMARSVAIPVGIALAISLYFDSRRGLRNLLRVDLMCLISLYFLTLVEFLFPQNGFDDWLTVEQTANGLSIILVGMGSFAVGRHLVKPKPIYSSWLRFEDISTQTLFSVFIGAAILGYFNMLLSVNFDIIRMINAMMGPRFSEPWARGAIGDWRTFISELALLLFLIPPLTGVIWNRRKELPLFKLTIIFAIFALTIFQGFAGGTRNLFAAYLATFVGAYLLSLPRHNFRNTVLPIIITLFIFVNAAYHMLEFRTIGLRNYLQNQVYASEQVRDTLSVDYNLYQLSVIADAMPANHDYIGLEILQWTLVKPIPRVLWPGKPLGLSVSMEEIVGAEGYTVSATYLGECYMMGGFVGVIGMSLFLGAFAAWWNRLALQKQSAYGMMVYALGFFVAGVTMRSMLEFTTLSLPVVALIAFNKIFLQKSPY